jgi:hypothetical protein
MKRTAILAPAKLMELLLALRKLVMMLLKSWNPMRHPRFLQAVIKV